MNKSVVVIYSGGMDSFTLVNEYISLDHDVHCLSFNYGQRHSKELDYAANFCNTNNLPHKIVDLTSIQELLLGSALTDDIRVPEGHYEEETMKSTVVPNRNMIMLSLAIGYAVSKDINSVAIGAHAGDHAIYPDCRRDFITAMNSASLIANYVPVSIEAPYIMMTKGEIASVGEYLGLDYGKAWTCYNGREKACGKCGACQERIEAMDYAGIVDPMEYEDE